MSASKLGYWSSSWRNQKFWSFRLIPTHLVQLPTIKNLFILWNLVFDNFTIKVTFTTDLPPCKNFVLQVQKKCSPERFYKSNDTSVLCLTFSWDGWNYSKNKRSRKSIKIIYFESKSRNLKIESRIAII